MRTKLYVIILVFISLGSECSILSGDNYLVARIYCSIWGYDVEVKINDILFKDMSGNVGCALHIFDKKHPLSKKLSEKSRGLFCLTGGNNDIEIAFKIIEGAKENYIKIEVLSDPELKTLFEYYNEDEFEGKITKTFYLSQWNAKTRGQVYFLERNWLRLSAKHRFCRTNNCTGRQTTGDCELYVFN